MAKNTFEAIQLFQRSTASSDTWKRLGLLALLQQRQKQFQRMYIQSKHLSICSIPVTTMTRCLFFVRLNIAEYA